MRAGFAGTPEFAARALAALHEDGYTIPLVLTQPDRPSGRGMTLAPSPVKRYALAHALRVEQPANFLATPTCNRRCAAWNRCARGCRLWPDTAAARPEWPRRGCLNILASLAAALARCAPIARLEAGDTVTGIKSCVMDAGLDTGPMLRRESIPIAADETAGTLHDRLATLGARLMVETLRLIEDDAGVEATTQPATGVTYAAKIDRAERRIDWTATATVLDRKVRAFSPAPGATAVWRGTAFRIVAATVGNSESGDSAPGTVVRVTRAGIDVACGAHTTLRLTALQPAGGRAMTAAAFAAGRGVVAGVPFETSVNRP
jgi:methionyl-tRNA formyltransferase